VTPEVSEDNCCRIIVTSFGEIQVPERDVTLALEYGSHIRQAAKTFLRINRISILIVDKNRTSLRWGNTTESGLAVYPWAFARGDIFVAENPPDEILSHEVGHDIMRRYLVPNTLAGQYGTDAPDWLDEAVAVSFEVPTDKAVRRCDASFLLTTGGLIPIRRFLRMNHPSLTNGNGRVRASDSIVYSSEIQPDTRAFYFMSLAFPEYLTEKLGNAAILREAIDSFKLGEPMDKWTLRRLRGSGKVKNAEQLDTDFQDWLRMSVAYHCKI